MKLKTLAAGIALTTAAVSAQSAVITIYDTNPDTAATNFENSLNSWDSENFDGMTGTIANGGTQQTDWMASANSFSTNVGTFTLTVAGNDFSGDDRPNELKIEANDSLNNTGEYGRESLSTYDGDLWLDSNDAREVKWEINTGNAFNAIGFYLADPNDQGGQIELTYVDGSTSSFQLLDPYSSGTLFYTTIVSDLMVSSATLTFGKDPLADGWGIDDIKVGTVPEPTTLALMGLGLAGLGAARRRKA